MFSYTVVQQYKNLNKSAGRDHAELHGALDCDLTMLVGCECTGEQTEKDLKQFIVSVPFFP